MSTIDREYCTPVIVAKLESLEVSEHLLRYARVGYSRLETMVSCHTGLLFLLAYSGPHFWDEQICECNVAIANRQFDRARNDQACG